MRALDARTLAGMATTTAKTNAKKEPVAATPWGSATVVEEVSVPQRAGDRRFTVVVQLLEAPGGERLIRFAYTTTGPMQHARARRGPVTMRARDIERLRAALERAPVLRETLGL
jgi:hypothetical protein